MKTFATMITCVVLASLFIGWLNDKDDTDPFKGRSGLSVYTDALTGCQYLKGGLIGGITPRLDASGKQVCQTAQIPQIHLDNPIR